MLIVDATSIYSDMSTLSDHSESFQSFRLRPFFPNTRLSDLPTASPRVPTEAREHLAHRALGRAAQRLVVPQLVCTSVSVLDPVASG